MQYTFGGRRCGSCRFEVELPHSRTIRARIPNNKNLMIEVKKLSVEESVFDADLSIDASEWYSLMRCKQNPVLLITTLQSNFNLPVGIIQNFCMGSEPTAETFLLAGKHFKFFEIEADYLCFSISISSVLGVTLCQKLKRDSNT